MLVFHTPLAVIIIITTTAATTTTTIITTIPQVRQIESLHDNVERIAFSFASGVPDHKLGGQCSLLKARQ